ncbi:MAG: hypothetical protein HKN47_17590 [Pirellulaceae bacterium]|nr:hypothetical protein [Pirellulaceae bacterium]
MPDCTPLEQALAQVCTMGDSLTALSETVQELIEAHESVKAAVQQALDDCRGGGGPAER